MNSIAPVLLLNQKLTNVPESVGNGTYVSIGVYPLSTKSLTPDPYQIGFLVLTLIGVAIPFFMADPNKMVRTDGTRVSTPRHPSWKVEIKGLWIALVTDPLILLLFPMFFASNWFYTWRQYLITRVSRSAQTNALCLCLEFSEYNGALFNIRARALNSLVYWMSQIVGSIAIGQLLDRKKLSRRIRAFSGWTVLFIMVFAVHIWAYMYQK